MMAFCVVRLRKASGVQTTEKVRAFRRFRRGIQT